jgi:hypothetical protein
MLHVHFHIPCAKCSQIRFKKTQLFVWPMLKLKKLVLNNFFAFYFVFLHRSREKFVFLLEHIYVEIYKRIFFHDIFCILIFFILG